MAFKDPNRQREYWREWYARPENAEKSKQNTRVQREKVRQAKIEAKSRPCADCGVQYPSYVMQFDHLRDKEFQIGTESTSKGFQQVMAEIAKCDVVCANCHAERTHGEGT